MTKMRAYGLMYHDVVERDAQASGRLERPQRAERPDVHDIDSIPQLWKLSRDDPIVKPQAALAAQDSVGHAKAAARKRCPHTHPSAERSVNDARIHEHFCTGSSASFDLMPRNRANAARADLVRKAIQNTD